MSVLYFYISILVSKEIHCGGHIWIYYNLIRLNPSISLTFSLPLSSTMYQQFPLSFLMPLFIQKHGIFLYYSSNLFSFPLILSPTPHPPKIDQKLHSLYLSVCTHKTYIYTYIMLDNVSQVQEDEDLMLAFIYGI
jgi:hypothetical protein